MIEAIDCQGFAGGFTLGMAQAGFTVVAKREEAGGFGVNMVDTNRNLINPKLDIQADDPDEWEPVKVPLVFGNPPCSGFSMLSGAATEAKAFRHTEKHANINECMWNLIRYAARCDPQIVIMESVQAAYTKGRQLMMELRAEMEQRTGRQYDLIHVLHNAAGVGGASIRRRYFMVLADPSLRFGIDPPEIEKVITVEDVLGDLYGQPLSEGPQPYSRPAEECGDSPAGLRLRSQSGLVDGHDLLYNTMTEGKAYLASMGWKPNEKSGKAFARLMAEGAMTWDDVYSSPMVHRHVEGPDGEMVPVVPTIYTSTHPFTPDRLHPGKAAPVMTGTGAMDFIHPVENRTITYREVARIMGFPDDWSIEPIMAAQRSRRKDAGKVLGKGITVQVGEWIGRWAKAALEGSPGLFRGYSVGDREWLIDFTNDHKSVYRERDGEVMDSRNPRLKKEMDVLRWQQIEADQQLLAQPGTMTTVVSS